VVKKKAADWTLHSNREVFNPAIHDPLPGHGQNILIASANQKTRRLEIIKSRQRHFSDFGWLKTFWLFSFSNYFDPQNIQFGPLRVFNDDVVDPEVGFPTHPHNEMEIITVVLEGERTHEDSMDKKSFIEVGDVQRMSAGTDLTHSEFNLADTPVHFYQIWILPNTPGLKPSYDQRNFQPSDWQNTLLLIASGRGFNDVVNLHTDATIYRSELEAGRSLSFDQASGRRLFLYLRTGEITVDGQRLQACNQARIDSKHPLSLHALLKTDFILIDLPSCKGWGYNKKTLHGDKKGARS